ncbi:alcohol dehydrogenase catalytic domain-containing protein [Solirubrobacter ginsenosidimutans]|uniref:Alcohol dehydrogenase catalytic domain-containing protein n=1 Tax=Solirubrobacter ginsenosidimutans TaxID=490573 RepID=A0A9X3MUM5_9ACTN|nr:alcohol dehydrogenase catalytic domain-containing protein [Solirubrobacter ginsenosidimutans]MDA0160088.1 alcohol dehydrogenase catalytic domain-containing protein [Solirubrobacter ginsenosidimutans]
MTAVRIAAPGQLALVDEPVGPPGPGDAIVKIAYAGICGSDRELLEGGRPAGFVRYPVIPGHEWSGVVSEVGAGADPRLVGRKVVGEGFRNCEACAACRTGQTTLCEAAYDETGFTQPGAWNDYLRLPARLLHVLPDDADLRAAALLEPAACVAEACLLAALVPGERAAVVGSGTLGMLSAQLLRASSPRELVVVARHASREPLALRMGADRFVTPDEVSPGFDVVIEAAGTPGSAQLAVDIARRGGRVVLTGIPVDVADGVSAQKMVTQAVSVFNVFGAPSRAWVHTVRAFAAGLLDPVPLVTHELPLSEIREAFRVMASEPGVGKILLRP